MSEFLIRIYNNRGGPSIGLTFELKFLVEASANMQLNFVRASFANFMVAVLFYRCFQQLTKFH